MEQKKQGERIMTTYKDYTIAALLELEASLQKRGGKMKIVKFFNGETARVRAARDRISWATHCRLVRMAEKSGYICRSGQGWAGYRIDGKTAVENQLGGLTGMIF
jgi:hypothetical protein